MALKPGQKDTFAEHRKATANSHVPLRQIGGTSADYTEGYAKIDWRKSTLDVLKKARKSLKAKRK